MGEGNSFAIVQVIPLSVDFRMALGAVFINISVTFPIEYNEESDDTAA